MERFSCQSRIFSKNHSLCLNRIMAERRNSQTSPCWLWTCRSSRLKLLFVKGGSGEGAGTMYWQKALKLSGSCLAVGKTLPSGISHRIRPENIPPPRRIPSYTGNQKQESADKMTSNRPEKPGFGQRPTTRKVNNLFLFAVLSF